MKRYLSLSLKIIVYSALCYFIYLMVLITLQYVPIDFKVAFLIFKEEEIKQLYYQRAFFVHVYSSIFVLIFGITQFSQIIRKKFTFIHQLFGKMYVILILFLAAPSGFLIGIHGNGGISSQLSFCLLSTLWFIFTLLALIKIRKKEIKAHRNFMILSYALTLSAISLRLFKWIIVNTIELAPMDTYKLVVWFGWIFNLIISLLIIVKLNKKTM